MSAILINDEIVHYEVLGRGRPLVFLHDWVGSWRYWIPAMQAASVSYRAYALDLWGFGDSARNPQCYPAREQAALLESFLQALGIGKIALVGHGLGAVIALLYARHNPAGVDRVMAISLPSCGGSLNHRLGSSAPQELAAWLLGRTPASEAARVEAAKTDPGAISLTINDLDSLDLLGLLGQLSTACLLVHGQNDPVVAAPRFDGPDGLPESAHQLTLDGSGHYPMLDEPARFNRLLSDFLSLGPGESPRQLQLKEEWKRRVR
jgi:pimeloyl-ACP methyl ester carboxylesterase